SGIEFADYLAQEIRVVGQVLEHRRSTIAEYPQLAEAPSRYGALERLRVQTVSHARGSHQRDRSAVSVGRPSQFGKIPHVAIRGHVSQTAPKRLRKAERDRQEDGGLADERKPARA